MKNNLRISELPSVLIISITLMLPACGGAVNNYGNAPNYTVGGSVSNLIVDGLVLQNNGYDDLAVSANSTSFTFPTHIPNGESYAVTVKAQPETQICLVTQATGTIDDGNVNNVGVQCSARMTNIEPQNTPDSRQDM